MYGHKSLFCDSWTTHAQGIWCLQGAKTKYLPQTSVIVIPGKHVSSWWPDLQSKLLLQD